MLSVATVTPAMGGNYYTKAEENYYTRDQTAQDYWRGSLCEEAGLTSGQQVQAEQFQLMLNNSGSAKCAAYDLTFSAPKSVSVMSETGNSAQHADMLAAHQAAVKATLEQIERREIGARITHGGITEHVHTGKMVCACFEHNISREVDPQLHTHCVIMNRTEYQGKDYAVDGQPLYHIQKVYGTEYRARLATELQERGYAVEITDVEKGFFELSGFKPETIQHFSKRRQQIEQAMQETGKSGAKAAQEATIETRRAKEHVNIEELRAVWKQERETLQDLPEKMQEITAPSGATRLVAYVEARKAMELREFAWTKEEMVNKVLSYGVTTGMTRAEAENLIDYDRQLLSAHLKGKDLGKVYLTTQAKIDREQKIFASIERGKGRGLGIQHSKAAHTLQEVCRENNLKLHPQQQRMVFHVAESKDRILGVEGLAGVGKSFSLNVCREVLERNGFEVRGMSASGQAAQELAADAHLEGMTADGAARCGTIHRILNEAEKQAGNAIKGEDYSQKTSWNFDGLQKSAKPTVWFMDEASLTDNNTLSYVVEMVERRGDKLVMVGDPSQLQPVGTGAAFTEAIREGRLSSIKLDNIQRQKEERLLASVKEAVLGKVDNSLDLISKDTREIKTGKARLNAIVKDYLKLSPEEQRKTVVLSAKNADRTALNRQIREGLVKNGQLDKGTVFQVEADKGKPTVAREFAAGDKIVFLQNDLKLGVMNGTKGVIKGIEGESFTVDCGEGKLVQFDLGRYRWIEHGYCLTTFKSQGMTIKRALINMSSKDRLLNSRNAYYVDLSRAKLESKLYIDSREKLEPQISKFAQKLTSKAFTFDKETGRFQKAAGKGIPALNGTVGRAVFSPAKGLQMAGELAGLVPVVGKPLQMAMSLSGKAVSLAGIGAKKLERGISDLSKAAKMAHHGLQETIRQVQQDKQSEKVASKQKGAELEI